ncbi:MAG: MFS transporter, partial [Pseudomonas stutzeri]|nr:MFS transporter [Stutzerimonas stutzeri]
MTTIARAAARAGISSRLQRLVNVEPHEVRAVAWAFLYFFSLLCSYYIVRPMRDEMGIAGGVENLQWLFTATFVAMLCAVPAFGWVTSRYPRPVFLPAVYLFFAACLLLFFFAFHSGLTHAWVARAFCVWV